MIKETLPIFISAALLSPYAVAQPVDNNENNHVNMEQPQAVSAFVTTLVIDAAKSAIKGKLKSVFSDALFGGGNSKLNNEVNLSKQSLDEIRNIVRDDSTKNKIAEYKSDLNTLKDLLADYQASFDNLNNSEKRRKQDTLNLVSTRLVNHELFNNSYYKEYRTKLVQTYSLAVSLRVAVLAEKVKNGDLSGNIDYINHVQSNMKNQLVSVGSETDSYIKSRIRVFEQKHCHGNNPVYLISSTSETMSSCRFPSYTYLVIDNIGSINNPVIEYTKRYTAERAMNGVISQYKNKFKGAGFNSLTTSLGESFTY